MRVKAFRRIAATLLIILISVIWIFGQRERRDRALSLLTANTYRLQRLFFHEESLVDYLDATNPGEPKKVILYTGDLGPGMNRIMQFDDCKYSNCILQYSNDVNKYAHRVDAIIFEHNSYHVAMTLPNNPLRFVYSAESPACWFDKFNRAINDFNGTITYWKISTPFSIPFGRKLPIKPEDRKLQTNYAQGKTKGAFAYVSHCSSKHYNRLDIMKELSKYIDVDIFGKCSGKAPCATKFDTACEAEQHSQYRFYLAFENSLCKEYISEKFFKSFESSGHFVPIAIGGLSLDEYTSIAPPDSFIHAYNFSSVEKLGRYLQTLMTDDAAYNRYHNWRQDFSTTMSHDTDMICNLCKILNHPEMLRTTQHRRFADEWNDSETCQIYDFKYS